MNSKEYVSVQRALRGELDEETLQDLRRLNLKAQPYLSNQIEFWLRKKKQQQQHGAFYDPHFIRREFERLEEMRSLHDLVVTFFQFVGKHVITQRIVHTFAQPFSNMFYFWNHLFKKLIVCAVTLLYDKTEWTIDDFFAVQDSVLRFLDGYPDALRTMVHRLGLTEDELLPTEYEKRFYGQVTLYPQNWGPLFWRVIHLVAESFPLRDDGHPNVRAAKTLWRSFVSDSLYRCLFCPECAYHYKMLAEKFADRLERDEDYAKLWYDIHNEVNATSGKTRHPAEDFERDREQMRRLLRTTEPRSDEED